MQIISQSFSLHKLLKFGFELRAVKAFTREFRFFLELGTCFWNCSEVLIHK